MVVFYSDVVQRKTIVFLGLYDISITSIIFVAMHCESKSGEGMEFFLLVFGFDKI